MLVLAYTGVKRDKFSFTRFGYSLTSVILVSNSCTRGTINKVEVFLNFLLGSNINYVSCDKCLNRI